MKVKTVEKWLSEIDPDENIKIQGDCLVTDNFIFKLPANKTKQKTKQKTKCVAGSALKRAFDVLIPEYQDSTGDGG